MGTELIAQADKTHDSVHKADELKTTNLKQKWDALQQAYLDADRLMGEIEREIDRVTHRIDNV
ncbi:MAG: hypothetical protein PHU23_00215 [Dehalococcoidales bacterium]|nr:hypothetical protein [Dehalococcoidales bacterium]